MIRIDLTGAFNAVDDAIVGYQSRHNGDLPPRVYISSEVMQVLAGGSRNASGEEELKTFRGVPLEVVDREGIFACTIVVEEGVLIPPFPDFLREVLTRQADPGSYLPRGDNHQEPLWTWEARAVALMRDEPRWMPYFSVPELVQQLVTYKRGLAEVMSDLQR